MQNSIEPIVPITSATKKPKTQTHIFADMKVRAYVEGMVDIITSYDAAIIFAGIVRHYYENELDQKEPETEFQK